MQMFLKVAALALLTTPIAAAPAYIGRVELPVRDATHATAGDLDGDGFADVVAVGESANLVAVYYGRGDGTFRYPPEVYQTDLDLMNPDLNPVHVSIGDLTDDLVTSLPDILVVTLKGLVDSQGQVEGNLLLLQNSGAPAGSPSRFASSCADMFLDQSGGLSGNQPSFALLDTFNGDNLLDIVASSQFGNAVQLLFQGYAHSGCVTTPVCDFGVADASGSDCAPTGTGQTNPTAMVSGLFLDGLHPGVKDVVVLNTQNERLAYMFHVSGDESKFLPLGPPQVFIVEGSEPVSLEKSLIDDDSLEDLLTANRASDDISVVLGQPAAGFNDPAFTGAIDSGGMPVGNRSTEYPAFARPAWVTTGELALGPAEPGGIDPPYRDAIVANPTLDQISVLPGDNLDVGGVFSHFLSPQCYPVGEGPAHVVASDFNGDLLDDVLVTQADGNSLSVMLSRDAPSWGFDITHRRRTGGNASVVAAGDADGDGSIDVVAGNTDTADLSVLRGAGDGSFSAVSNRAATGTAAIAIASGGFDTDAADDFAALTGTGQVRVYLGILGDGSLSHAGNLDAAAGATALVAGAVDTAAGDPVDLIVASPGTLEVFTGLGTGKFEETPTTVALGFDPTALVAGDFNAVAGIDLVALDAGNGSVVVLDNDGAGNFTVGASIATGAVDPNGLAVGLLDSGAALNLVVTHDDAQVVALLGDGAGSFTAQAPIQLFDPAYLIIPSAPAIGELDGTGDGDAMLLLNESDTALVLPWSGGNLSLEFAESYGTGPDPRAAVVAPFESGAPLDSIVIADGLDLAGNGVTALSTGRFDSYPPVDAGASHELCADAPATVTLGAPGKDFVDYLWTPAAGLSAADVPQPTTNAAGTYTLTASNPQTGVMTSDEVTVTISAAPAIDVQPDPAGFCTGNVVPICLDAGAGHLEYVWSVGGVPTGDTGRFLVVAPAGPTTYDVEVTSTAGCTASGSRMVQVVDGARANGFVSPLVQCAPSPAATVTFDADASSTSVPGGASAEYRWSLVGGPADWSVSPAMGLMTTVSADPPYGPMTVTLRLEVETTPGGCISTREFQLEVLPNGAMVDVGNSLLAVWTTPAHTDVELTWGDASASGYEVFAADADKTMLPGTSIGTPAAPTFQVAAPEALRFYQVDGDCF